MRVTGTIIPASGMEYISITTEVISCFDDMREIISSASDDLFNRLFSAIEGVRVCRDIELVSRDIGLGSTLVSGEFECGIECRKFAARYELCFEQRNHGEEDSSVSIAMSPFNWRVEVYLHEAEIDSPYNVVVSIFPYNRPEDGEIDIIANVWLESDSPDAIGGPTPQSDWSEEHLRVLGEVASVVAGTIEHTYIPEESDGSRGE